MRSKFIRKPDIHAHQPERHTLCVTAARAAHHGAESTTYICGKEKGVGELAQCSSAPETASSQETIKSGCTISVNAKNKLNRKGKALTAEVCPPRWGPAAWTGGWAWLPRPPRRRSAKTSADPSYPL